MRSNPFSPGVNSIENRRSQVDELGAIFIFSFSSVRVSIKEIWSNLLSSESVLRIFVSFVLCCVLQFEFFFFWLTQVLKHLSMSMKLDLDVNQSREAKKERNNDENTSLV